MKIMKIIVILNNLIEKVLKKCNLIKIIMKKKISNLKIILKIEKLIIHIKILIIINK